MITKCHFLQHFSIFSVENIHNFIGENTLSSSVKSPVSVDGASIHEDCAILQRVGLTEKDRISLQELSEYTKSTEFLFGERFMLMNASWGTAEIAVTRLRLSEDLIAESSNYIMHPCIIDACLQTKVCIDLKRTAINSPNAPSLPIGELTMKLLTSV